VTFAADIQEQVFERPEIVAVEPEGTVRRERAEVAVPHHLTSDLDDSGATADALRRFQNVVVRNTVRPCSVKRRSNCFMSATPDRSIDSNGSSRNKISGV
jgi:hypothetical protein